MINDFKDGGLRMLDIRLSLLIKPLSALGLKNIWTMRTKANGNFSWIGNWNVLGGRCFLLTT